MILECVFLKSVRKDETLVWDTLTSGERLHSADH